MSDILERVYQVFDPEPLSADDDALYVDLDDVRGSTGIVNKLANNIRLSSTPTCQLLTGHRGSGKSTELGRLKRELETGEKRTFVVYCQSDDDIDRNDVDFPDILVAIVRQMAAQIKDRTGISLKPGYFTDRWERVKGVLGSEVSFEGLELDVGMLKLSGAIKSSPDARLELRKLLEPDTSNLLHAANDIIGEAKLELGKQGYRDLAIMVDDLDKMVLRPHPSAKYSTGEYLFIHREGQLTAFACHMVYTIPLPLAYSMQGPAIASLYRGTIRVVPMTKVIERPPNGGTHRPGMERFRELIAARLKKAGVKQADVFSNTVRDDLIKLAGGQPRELMILIREALISGQLPVDKAGVERAAREGRRAYARQLRAEHWPILEEVEEHGGFTRTEANDAQVRDVLDSRAILQYVNDEEWYALNPLIEGLTNPSST